MQQIWPDFQDVSFEDAYIADIDRTVPFMRINMVQSLDGKISYHGRSHGISSKIDKRCFHLMRSSADALLVGSATARIENYKPVIFSDAIRSQRSARGQNQELPIVLVTDTFNLDFSQELFKDSHKLPIVACSAKSAERAKYDMRHYELLVAGEDHIDFAQLKVLLFQRGHHHVLCEGGPTLIAHLLDAGIIDELCLTISPKILHGERLQITGGSILKDPNDFQINKIFFEQGQLFLRMVPLI